MRILLVIYLLPVPIARVHQPLCSMVKGNSIDSVYRALYFNPNARINSRSIFEGNDCDEMEISDEMTFLSSAFIFSRKIVVVPSAIHHETIVTKNNTPIEIISRRLRRNARRLDSFICFVGDDCIMSS
jgi:hypothetical protein